MRTLVADDDPIIATILSATLARSGMEVVVAHDGDVAWQALNSIQPPSLAILDWMMPNLDGVELCRRIRSTPRLAATYVILVTGRGSREDLVMGLEAGADDYMVKPINMAELQARVGVGLRVATLQQNLTSTVTELRSTRDRLARMASTDVLTGVYSRRWWFDLAGKEFSRSRRYDRTFSLLMADLDWFKQINDTFGHEAGDGCCISSAACFARRAASLTSSAGWAARSSRCWCRRPRPRPRSTSRRASSRRAARSSSMAPQATCNAHAASASPKCTRTMSGWTAC
jgi:PleD family two-component response regulator